MTCANNQIRNPMTGRCVNRSGKIGKQILERRSKSIQLTRSSQHVKQEFRRKQTRDNLNFNNEILTKYGIDINDVTPGYTATQLLGEGSYGVVYKICNEFNCKVVKIQTLNANVKQDKRNIAYEVEMQNMFASYGLAPYVQFVQLIKYKNRYNSIIVMDLVYNILEETILTKRLNYEYLDLIVDGLVDVIMRMSQIGITHGDMHWGNIAELLSFKNSFEPSILLVDFGQSSNTGANPKLEFLQLLRSSYTYFENSNNPYNKQTAAYVRERLFKEYKKLFPRDGLKLNFNMIDKRHQNEWNKHFTQRQRYKDTF